MTVPKDAHRKDSRISSTARKPPLLVPPDSVLATNRRFYNLFELGLWKPFENSIRAMEQLCSKFIIKAPTPVR